MYAFENRTGSQMKLDKRQIHISHIFEWKLREKTTSRKTYYIIMYKQAVAL